MVLGIFEGLTEFLPVSSTGHPIVTEQLTGSKDTGKVFTIVIQLGAILAVVWFYWRQLWPQVGRVFQGSRQARQFWLDLIVASIPAAVIGLLFERPSRPRWSRWAGCSGTCPPTIPGALPWTG